MQIYNKQIAEKQYLYKDVMGQNDPSAILGKTIIWLEDRSTSHIFACGAHRANSWRSVGSGRSGSPVSGVCLLSPFLPWPGLLPSLCETSELEAATTTKVPSLFSVPTSF